VRALRAGNNILDGRRKCLWSKLRTAVAISKFAAHPARDVTLARTDAAFHAE
jgi:hypothetical protein